MVDTEYFSYRLKPVLHISCRFSAISCDIASVLNIASLSAMLPIQKMTVSRKKTFILEGNKWLVALIYSILHDSRKHYPWMNHFPYRTTLEQWMFWRWELRAEGGDVKGFFRYNYTYSCIHIANCTWYTYMYMHLRTYCPSFFPCISETLSSLPQKQCFWACHNCQHFIRWFPAQDLFACGYFDYILFKSYSPILCLCMLI